MFSPDDFAPCYSVTGTGDGSIGDGSWGSEYGGVGSFETSSPMVPIPTEGLVSVFSITATAFKLAVPLVANANSNKQNIFKKAFNTAYNLLKSPKCDSAFGTGRPGNALQGLLQNANYVYSNVTSQGPIPSDDLSVDSAFWQVRLTINSGATTNFSAPARTASRSRPLPEFERFPSYLLPVIGFGSRHRFRRCCRIRMVPDGGLLKDCFRAPMKNWVPLFIGFVGIAGTSLGSQARTATVKPVLERLVLKEHYCVGQPGGVGVPERLPPDAITLRLRVRLSYRNPSPRPMILPLLKGLTALVLSSANHDNLQSQPQLIVLSDE